MMRYGAYRQRGPGGQVNGAVRRNRFDGYQYSLFPAPRQAASAEPDSMPHTVRAVAPALRPLMARTGNRCPDCTGPLINGEGCVACPICGFRRQGW